MGSMESDKTDLDALTLLLQSWDLSSIKTSSVEERLQDIKNISCVDLFSCISSLSNSKWDTRHSKTLCYCFKLGSAEWLKSAVDKIRESAEFQNQFWSVLQHLLQASEISELPDIEIYELDHSNFANCADNSTCSMQFCLRIFQLLQELNTDSDWLINDMMTKLGKYIVVLITSNLDAQPWTSESSIPAAVTLLEFLLAFYQCKNLHGLLMLKLDHGHTLFQDTLAYLRLKVQRKKWKRNPSYVKSCVTCLLKVKHPDLGEYLDDVLPVSLTLVDDHMIENKVTGIKCVLHLIENTSKTELQWQNRGDVIFEAIKLQLYSKEITVLEIALPCMLAILKVVEPLPKVTEPFSIEPRKNDEIFSMILFNAEMENLIAVRRTYTKYLTLFVTRMGVTVVKHSRRLLRLVSSYLEVYDGPEEIIRFNTLKILNAFIIQAWPRIPHHVPHIVKSLLQLVYDVSVDNSSLTPGEVKKNLIEESKSSLRLLHQAANTQVTQCLKAVLEIETTPTCVNIMKEVLNSS